MTNQEIANTILQQLGGRKFIMMTGAKNLMFGEQNLSFRIGRNAKKVNYVKITLTADDLYNVEFGYVRGLNYTVRDVTEGAYADMLKNLFESATGMYTSL